MLNMGINTMNRHISNNVLNVEDDIVALFFGKSKFRSQTLGLQNIMHRKSSLYYYLGVCSITTRYTLIIFLNLWVFPVWFTVYVCSSA